LYGVTDANTAKLQRVQNSLARAVCELPYGVSTAGMLRELHWLPAKQRITYKIASITYRTCHSSQPVYLRDLLTNYQPARTLRSSNSHSLVVPNRVKTVATSLAFSVTAPTIWNNLPVTVKTADSFNVFKHRLKCHLFVDAAFVNYLLMMAGRRLCLTACGELRRLKSNILYCNPTLFAIFCRGVLLRLECEPSYDTVSRHDGKPQPLQVKVYRTVSGVWLGRGKGANVIKSNRVNRDGAVRQLTFCTHSRSCNFLLALFTPKQERHIGYMWFVELLYAICRCLVYCSSLSSTSHWRSDGTK